MPRVDVVQKHNASARRLYIRGHNGKIYPYLVINDSGLADARREERVLQLLRMLNLYLGKQKVQLKLFLLHEQFETIYWSLHYWICSCREDYHCKSCVFQETARRFLHYTVPRVVAVSQQIRLVEDNPASLSLLDIFKNGCTKLGKYGNLYSAHYC